MQNMTDSLWWLDLPLSILSLDWYDKKSFFFNICFGYVLHKERSRSSDSGTECFSPKMTVECFWNVSLNPFLKIENNATKSEIKKELSRMRTRGKNVRFFYNTIHVHRYRFCYIICCWQRIFKQHSHYAMEFMSITQK